MSDLLTQDLRVFKNKSEVHPKVAQDSSHHSEPSTHTHRHPDVVKIQHSSDDLRIGDFEFVVDESTCYVLPGLSIQSSYSSLVEHVNNCHHVQQDTNSIKENNRHTCS